MEGGLERQQQLRQICSGCKAFFWLAFKSSEPGSIKRIFKNLSPLPVTFSRLPLDDLY